MKRTRFATCILLILVWSTSALAAPQAAKQPWQWTDEERLAARFNPAAVAERNAAHQKVRAKATSSSTPSAAGGLQYVIDGRRNPELFMRHELLDHLLLRGLGTNVTDAGAYRQALAPFIVAVGLDPGSFWTELRGTGESYLRLKQRLQGTGHGYGRADERALCAARAGMLAAAERRFGRETFDKLLYTGVAPSIVHSSSTTYPDAADRLRRETRGCQ